MYTVYHYFRWIRQIFFFYPQPLLIFCSNPSIHITFSWLSAIQIGLPVTFCNCWIRAFTGLRYIRLHVCSLVSPFNHIFNLFNCPCVKVNWFDCKLYGEFSHLKFINSLNTFTNMSSQRSMSTRAPNTNKETQVPWSPTRIWDKMNYDYFIILT